jgi:hypothetical protein
MAGGLLHRTIYEARDACWKILPLTKGVASKIHLQGSYPLLRWFHRYPNTPPHIHRNIQRHIHTYTHTHIHTDTHTHRHTDTYTDTQTYPDVLVHSIAQNTTNASGQFALGVLSCLDGQASSRDPVASRRTAIIGMLVIRQAFDGWQGKMSQRDIMASDSWAYGVKGIMVHHPLRRL